MASPNESKYYLRNLKMSPFRTNKHKDRVRNSHKAKLPSSAKRCTGSFFIGTQYFEKFYNELPEVPVPYLPNKSTNCNSLKI